MDVPFHRVKVCGDILVTARGASVHTFHAVDGAYIATWRLPKPAGKEDGAKSKKNGTDKGSAAPTVETSSATPPPKRRRLESAAGAKQQQQTGEDAPSKEQRKKRSAAAAVTAALRSGDLPVVSILEATADGHHVIVVMGHDKTVRVLAHDLQGHIEQISQRTVPKRPSAVAITADGQTILVGDKFGDVYALPLIETEESKKAKAAAKVAEQSDLPVVAAAPTTSTATTTTTITTPLQLQANSFTVHTKGNLQALENQRRQKELQTQQKAKQHPQDAADCRLLLGHVSMLTAVAVAEAVPAACRGSNTIAITTTPPRPLILSADRDEHIRVTRGVIGSSPATSQTHVIETFCLGHTSFVSRMCIAATRPDRLVSAGGDGELRVWDFWPDGRTVSSASLAPLVEQAVGSSTVPQVAVSGLYTFPTDSSPVATSSIVAICERVPAVFFFVLEPDGTTLTHAQTLQLPGLPLDIGVLAPRGETRLAVALAAKDDSSDADEATYASASLLVVARGHGQAAWQVQEARLGPLPEESYQSDQSDIDVDPVALRHLLLFGTDSLRKSADETGGD
ncbi:tRNA methyltransferase [Grosmannia clavigera kw1407]|uniref:tRNA methyltransferase n=1 Tax=Grosmannia clavigera (strain kw1407 / UAMH 11150) TaxID=655863 RepID=F0XS23_GROCL|nr:tRNA methyltransferase [Grosmannia clavigera kw1407]EFW99629.1 tRNA methyltransferase [Grosmannia clavigera kw1407]